MSPRATGGMAALALAGGAALAAGLALRVLRQERNAVVVPLQRLSRKYKSRAGLVPAAHGEAAGHRWRLVPRPACCPPPRP